MSSKRVFFIMLGALSLSIGLLIGGAVLGDTLLKKQSDKLLSLKLESHVLDDQQLAVVQANKDIQKYADLEKTANAIVPQDKDQAKTVRELAKIADSTGVSLGRISFPTSTLGQVVPKPSTSQDSSTSTPKPATPAISQVKPVDGMSGVYQMEVDISSDNTKPIHYSSLINFLSQLEHNRRTAQVSNIAISPDSKDNSRLNFTLGINVFIRP